MSVLVAPGRPVESFWHSLVEFDSMPDGLDKQNKTKQSGVSLGVAQTGDLHRGKVGGGGVFGQ